MDAKAEGLKTVEVKPKNQREKKTGNSGNSEVTAEGTDLLTIAEGADLLRTGGDATAGSVVFLCRATAVSYLKHITKSGVNDIRTLGKIARTQGIQVDARDMAWLNDFDLGEDAYLQEATPKDADLAISILDKVKRCCQL